MTGAVTELNRLGGCDSSVGDDGTPSLHPMARRHVEGGIEVAFAPTKVFFDKTWKLPDIEQIADSTLAKGGNRPRVQALAATSSPGKIEAANQTMGHPALWVYDLGRSARDGFRQRTTAYQ
jgi:hypothetical protein